MSKFIRIFTAFAIFVHSMGGCCTDEVHGVVSHFLEHFDNHDADSHGFIGHRFTGHRVVWHDHEALFEHVQPMGEEDCHRSHEPVKPEPHACYHAGCKWPAPEVRHSTEIFLTSYWASSGFYLELPSALSLSDDGVFLTDFKDPSSPALPVRLHLAKCVILI